MKQLLVVSGGRNLEPGAQLPALLSKTLSYVSDSFAFSPVHDGLWARIEPTPRALSFVSHELVRAIETHIAQHSQLGLILAGLSLR